VLPARLDSGEAPPALKVPVWSIVLLGSAALTISVAQVPTNVGLTAALLAISLVLVGAFIVVDRCMAVKVLPPSVFGAGPLKWIYLALAVLMASAMVDMYVPLFGQRLAHLVPVAAGFLGAALALTITGIGIGAAWPASVGLVDAVHRRRGRRSRGARGHQHD
jgi:hypothetical protein